VDEVDETKEKELPTPLGEAHCWHSGIPKGVMLTHQNLVSSTIQAVTIGAINSSDVFIGVLPFYHIYG